MRCGGLRISTDCSDPSVYRTEDVFCAYLGEELMLQTLYPFQVDLVTADKYGDNGQSHIQHTAGGEKQGSI